MLTKIEALYLGILRVFILIVATFALLAAVFAFVSAGPPLLRHLGLGWGSSAAEPMLSQFIQEKGEEGAVAQAGNADFSPVRVPTLSADAAAAARTLHEYTKDRSGATEADWQRSVVAFVQNAPPPDRDAYQASLKRLADQLGASKGVPLSMQQVGELLRWHQQRFLAARAVAAGQNALDAGQFILALYSAGAAFLFFIFITFTFLFVKIERSLRSTRAVKAELPSA
jgi:hypothetical protein